LRFPRSDRYAVQDRDEQWINDPLKIALAPIIEACAVLSQADASWAYEWTEATGYELPGYWDFQEDGKQRPVAAMQALASKLMELFEGSLEKEDADTLASELRILLGAASFLSYFKGEWDE